MCQNIILFKELNVIKNLNIFSKKINFSDFNIVLIYTVNYYDYRDLICFFLILNIRLI